MPPYFRLVLGVGLLKRLKDDLLLFGRNADAGIGDFKGNNALRAAEHRMVARPAGWRGKDLELNAAALGELERVRKQILENLLKPLGIRGDAAPRVGSRSTSKESCLVSAS